jgi:hypothetical protein
MEIGSAHSSGLYTVPNGSGTQLADGCDVIWDLGCTAVKLYLTADYLTNYPLQSAWSSTPTTLTQLASTTQFATQLAREWDSVFLTTFGFSNGSGGWWINNPTIAKYQAEYTEMKALAAHLLTTYSGTGRTFVLQTWEGDWAYMDSTTPTTFVQRTTVDRYAAFLGTRQRAIEDARRETAHSNVKVLNCVEVNRVVDRKLGRRRIVNSIAERVRPDMVSYSAYDSTIVLQGGWGANYAAWRAATEPVFREAVAAIKTAWPGVPWVLGEFGYPENEVPAGGDVQQMLSDTIDWAEELGATHCLFWQVFDNEAGTPPDTYRGYWLQDADGNWTEAAQVLASYTGATLS